MAINAAGITPDPPITRLTHEGNPTREAGLAPRQWRLLITGQNFGRHPDCGGITRDAAFVPYLKATIDVQTK